MKYIGSGSKTSPNPYLLCALESTSEPQFPHLHNRRRILLGTLQSYSVVQGDQSREGRHNVLSKSASRPSMEPLLRGRAKSARGNCGCFCVGVNALPGPKCSLSRQPIPESQGSSELYTHFLFLKHFLLFSSLSHLLYPAKASCLLPHFAILWALATRDCLLHEVLNKCVCIT